MHTRLGIYKRLGISAILAIALLATVFAALSIASSGLPNDAQPPSDLELFERVLSKAETAEERQAVAQTFLVWRPQMAEQPSGVGMTIRDLAYGPEADVAITDAGEDPRVNGFRAQLFLFDVTQRLSAEDQLTLNAVAADRVAHLTEVISDAHFEVHYTTTPTATYPNDHVTHTYAAKVLDYLGKSYDTEITSWGYKAGASKDKVKYQVFIHDLGGAFGNTRDFSINPDNSAGAVRTFTTIGVAPNLADDSLLLSTIAHEYHHASQLAYMKITGYKLWILESSTAWLEYQVRKEYPAVVGNGSWNLIKQRMEWFQTHTSWGIASTSAEGGGVTNDYDGAIWWWFLANNTKSGDLSGTGTARQINLKFWQKLAEKADWNKIYEAFDDVLVKADYDTMNKAFGHFLTAAVLPKEWFPTGAEAIRKANTQQVRLDQIFASDNKKTYTAVNGGTPDTLYRYGQWYFELIPGASVYDVVVEFDGDNGTDFIVKLITLRDGAFHSETSLGLDGNKDGESGIWRLDPANKETGIVVVGRTSDSKGDYKVTFKTVRNFVFVIDDTGSMGNDIANVKQVALNKVEQMAASGVPWNWSLITFKDSVSVRGTTTNSETIKSWLNSLVATGGDDCPEESLGALRAVPGVTQPPADAWLFTDASPHGGPFALAGTILALANQNIRVHPFILSWCWDSAAASLDEGQCNEVPGQDETMSTPEVEQVEPRIGDALLELLTTDNELALAGEKPAVLSQEALHAMAQATAGEPWSSPRVQNDVLPQDMLPTADGTDLALYFSSYDDTIVQDHDTRYTIYAYTTNNISATGTIMTLTLPAGVSYVTYTVYYPSQAGGGLTPAIMGNDVVWDLGTVPTPGSGYASWYQYFYVDTHVASDAITGTTQVSVTISTLDGETSYTNNGDARTQSIVEPARDMYVYKSLSSPATNRIIPGAELVYYVSYQNYGNAPASDVVLTDTLPAATTFITSTSYTSMTVDGQSLVWDLGTVDAGAYGWFYVYAQVDGGALPGTVLTNTVVITTSDVDEGNYQDRAIQINTVVSPTVDVYVDKSLSNPGSNDVIPTAELQYYVYFRNFGNTAARDVYLTDTLPSELKFITATRTVSLTVEGNTLSWEIGSLDPDYYGSFYIYAQVLTNTAIGTVLTNTVVITTTDLDEGLYQTRDVQVNTVVTPAIDLGVSKSPEYDLFLPGENITYTISYGNWGNWSATDVRITDTVMAGLEYYSSTLAPISVDGQQVVWDLGAVENGDYGVLDLYARQTRSFGMGDNITNVVKIGGLGAEDRYAANNSSQAWAAIGERDGLLAGGAPYVQIAEGTGGHYLELRSVRGDPVAMANAADIVFTEMSSDAALDRRFFDPGHSNPHTETYSVRLDGFTGQANFFLNGRPGSNLGMALHGPGGLTIAGSSLLATAQTISHTVVGNSEYYRVYNPIPGVWQAVISGTGAFVFSASASTEIIVEYIGDTSLAIGAQAAALVRVEGPVASVAFSFVTAGGTLLQTVDLYDDGIHGDGTAGDGVYGGVWVPTSSESHYLKVVGTDTQGRPFERTDTTPIKSQGMSVVAPLGQTVLPGDTVTYTFAINNGGGSADTYNLTYESSQGWANTSGLPVAISVAAHGTQYVSVPVEVSSGAEPGSLDSLELSAISQSDANLGDSGVAFTTVAVVIDLSVEKQVNRTVVVPECTGVPCPPPMIVQAETIPVHGPVTYTIIYTNDGESVATGVTITDVLPSEVVYLSDDSGVAASWPAPATLVWSLPDLLANNTRSFNVRGWVSDLAAQEQVLTNSVKIATTGVETETTNNQAQASFIVRGEVPLPPYDVTVEGPTGGSLGSEYTFTATVNPGSAVVPITYTWEATDKGSASHPAGGASDAITFTWSTTGTKVITVTARNVGGRAVGFHSITIIKACRVYLPLVLRN